MMKSSSRFQCPDDFVSLRPDWCSSSLTRRLDNNNHTELWLIKAPPSFSPDSLRGIKVPLSGLQTLRVESGGVQQIYSVLASAHGTSELRLLSADHEASGSVLAPPFSGLLNVCESYGDCSANQTPQVIPAAPPPSVPPGLKQRFHPFGSRTPTLTCVATSETDGAACGPSSATLRPLVVKHFTDETEEDGVEDGRTKKKKKKKEKRIKTEREEEPRVKVELVAELQDEVMMEEKRRKRKRDREREEVEQGIEPSVGVKVEQVTVKCEPLDTLYGDTAEHCGAKKKKKKKKKKSNTEDE